MSKKLALTAVATATSRDLFAKSSMDAGFGLRGQASERRLATTAVKAKKFIFF